MRTLSRLALLLLLAAPADAQVREGLVELGGGASFTNRSFDGGSFTALRFSPRVGYFLTAPLEAGVQLDYTKFENSDGRGDLTVFTAYHFGARGATTVPFLRAQIGTSLTGDSDLVFGGAGGARFFFLPGGALTPEIFLLTTGDVTDIGAAAGVSIFF